MIALTRTFGAHSIASDFPRWMSPALAAPYAAVPGEGRAPLAPAAARRRLRRPAATDDHVRAGVEEARGDPAPDPAAPAGDDDDLAGHVERVRHGSLG